MTYCKISATVNFVNMCALVQSKNKRIKLINVIGRQSLTSQLDVTLHCIYLQANIKVEQILNYFFYCLVLSFLIHHM